LAAAAAELLPLMMIAISDNYSAADLYGLSWTFACMASSRRPEK